MINITLDVMAGKTKLAVNILLLITLAIFITPSIEAMAGEYETPGNRRASDILSQKMIKGPHYRIRDRVVSYGYMHHYTVDSDYGIFKVTGDGALRKFLKEIKAISILKEITDSKAFGESVKGAIKKPIHFGKDLITDPVDTISGIPEGVSTLFKNIATSITKEHDPSEDARAKQILQVSAYKREYAYRLGVDVYSNNSVLQEELNRVGWAGAVGSLSITAITFPAQGPVVTVGKTMRLADQIGEVIKEEPPSRLRLINEKKLSAMGVSEQLAEKFLDHSSFTPRHDTIIVSSLSKLKGAQGYDTFITFALSAKDEQSANFCQHMAETLTGYHAKVSLIKKITLAAGLVVAQDESGAALIPFPLDHGVWTKRAEKIINKLAADLKAAGYDKRELWVAGTLSPLARKQMEQRGIRVTENVDKRLEFID